MNSIRLAHLTALSMLALLGGAAAQPLPPANVPGGAPPGVYVPSSPPGGQYPGGGQYAPPPPGDTTNSACVRLESELARLDTGNAGADGARRYEDAIARQRFELDQTTAQGRRLGCDSGGGFFIFGNPKPPQCDQINTQITRMRSNLDRMISEMNQSRGGGTDLNRDLQRRQIIAALQQNNCGSQYRSAPPQQATRQRGFLETLFGGWREESDINASPLELPSSSTFKTVCVRTCDGYYFPISYATVPSRFGADEQACRRLCPAAEVSLYTHRNPGEEIEQAVSLGGRAYTELPTAFKYRQEYNSACSCRAAGQSWADALGVGRDATVQQGDIIVTEERAKQLAQPRAAGQPARSGAANTPGQPAGSGQPATGDANPPAQTDQPAGERKVRTVGPQFYPVR